MPSIFTKIIRGELPGRFVWRDPRAVAFLTIAPITPGHTLVVPIEEVEHWIDLDPALAAHLMGVAQWIGRAIEHAYRPTRVGMMIAGLEVPHVHLHLIAINRLGDLSFANADSSAKPADLDAAAAKLRASLRALGRTEVSD